MREMIHFLHPSQGNAHLRPHDGQTFLYDNGAFRLFNGVIPESVLLRCRAYAALAEWRLWCLAKKPAPRGDGGILQAMDFLSRSIAEPSRNAQSADLEDTGVAPDAQQRGVKRRRPWSELPGDHVALSTGDLGEKEVIYALRELSLDKWCAGKPIDERLKTWGAHEAVQPHAMLRKLAVKVETAEIMKR